MDKIYDIDFKKRESSIIKIFGVGGGGSNAVNHMFKQGITGVEFVVCNTDIQALRDSPVRNKIQLGSEGLGAGCRPEKGEKAAVETMDYISLLLENNTKMIFITAGMGGGTGTGAAPVIAKRAQELNILTIAIVTIPFRFEGKAKIEQAMSGIDKLEKYVDAILIINNEKLRDMYGDLRLSQAFAKADSVLTTAAKTIAEIITKKGYVNVDFADVEGIMRNSGVALMGSGEADGENRAIDAVRLALVSPLLNAQEIGGAKNIFINVLYENKEVTHIELGKIAEYLRERVGVDADIIWGSGEYHDEGLGDKLRVSIIVTGFNTSGRFISTDDVPETKIIQEVETEIKVDKEEELTMIREDAAEIEKKARKKGRRKKIGRNEIPNADEWIFDKIFTDSSKDSEM